MPCQHSAGAAGKIDISRSAHNPVDALINIRKLKEKNIAVFFKKDALQKGKYSSKYVLSDIRVCAECGHPYRRQVWTETGDLAL